VSTVEAEKNSRTIPVHFSFVMKVLVLKK